MPVGVLGGRVRSRRNVRWCDRGRRGVADLSYLILYVVHNVYIVFGIAAAFVFLHIVMVIGVEIEVRHQVGLNIIHRFSQCLQELVEIFLVQEDLVPVIPVFIEFLPAFGYSKIIIITTGCPYIKEISPAFRRP